MKNTATLPTFLSEDTTPAFNRDAALSSLNASLSVLARRYSAYAGKQMSEEGITHTMAWPMVMLGRLGDGVRLSALANILCIEGPSLVRTVDQLVERGLVERTEDPQDRRAKMLFLTAKGKAACERIEVKLSNLRTNIYQQVTDQDIQACLRVFDLLTHALGTSVPEIPDESTPDFYKGRKDTRAL